LPETIGGLPAFYYWKDALTSGRYVHPTKQFSLKVTPQRLAALARNFHEMKQAGIAVPILADHAERADSALGFIVDVKVENGWLRELHQFLGPEARDLGLRNGVSLGLAPAYVDGRGRNWGEAIAHSALTPLPVVAGQGPFEAAKPAESGIWTLAMTDEEDESSAADPPDDAGRDDTEDAIAAPPDPANPAAPDGPFILTPQQMDRLRQLIPDADVLDAATLVDRLLDLLEAANEEAGQEAETAAQAPTNLSSANDAVAKVQRQMLQIRRNLLVERGALTPAAADALMAAMLPASGSTAGVVTLSNASQDATNLAGAVFDALEHNHPAPQGELSGLQALARVPPGDPLAGGELPFRRMADRFNGRH
jgi:hypothetical protein